MFSCAASFMAHELKYEVSFWFEAFLLNVSTYAAKPYMGAL